ncbi:MAG: hypothetical protein A2315_16360 [Ignavibacteria bacterium RIFOXYB2_FULL_35_12]|nr:MAG: hypothetical protein A2058_11005 [Ignavibacteria bacterium GWA2_36_19]OGU49334.1 MAG: hypothetical protein A2006_11900 [Ignavibacteria bacterium GWC2_35_8]OGU61263.1 MAG: hypothetical protein A2X60_13275 [Ignavibacteria bacterium GWF2_35_20]OGU78885.1 MAG: hypothetical protein A2254_13600 [Ignavibacteria bacterium RIFOXYA2_FULL_35_9]OGU83222.1 MAG: hypothetical protein A2W11_06120 [Ignavibacteria bacterium RBG_16_35_7]OGU84335.1 MAG: hypothetical protein A3K31_17170 [Ignavibacteria bac
MVSSGYRGGKVKNPTNEDVCSGTMEAAEVIQVWFDPLVTSYDELFKVFWKTYDSSTLTDKEKMLKLNIVL